MNGSKGRRPHPYRSGNYKAVQHEVGLTPCVCQGQLPRELLGGMYVRNGSNPAVATTSKVKVEDLPEAYHWFDGDGMLAGVLFEDDGHGNVQASFVNRFVLTDLLLASRSNKPVLPSISTLLSPLARLPLIVASIGRAFALAALSHFSARPIERLSVANTSVLWHDGRALAGCESGPLCWIRLPALETVGWWDLEGDDGEPGMRERGGTLGWMKEWTTAHPKRDPETGELILFHSSLLPPYLSYSVVPSTQKVAATTPRIVGAPVPIPGPRMMHDCAASAKYTILLDMPLSLDPLNLVRGKPVVSFSPTTPSRFGVLPRHRPEAVRWYEASPSVIFHTAVAWGDPKAVHLVCCRLNSSHLVYAAGNLDVPASEILPQGKQDTCELHYYRFPLDCDASAPRPTHSFPLAAIPFEFPTLPFSKTMKAARFVYGCSMRHGTFSAALGQAAKIDCLVKVDIQQLVERGTCNGNDENTLVDARTVEQILNEQHERNDDETNEVPIRIFTLPDGLYAQESSFVPRSKQRSEDDGFLLTYVFDESQLDPETGDPIDDARSELWVIDAWNMKDVVARVKLPQRVPYGLHGNWFTPDEIARQRPAPQLRRRPSGKEQPVLSDRLESIRQSLVNVLG